FRPLFSVFVFLMAFYLGTPSPQQYTSPKTCQIARADGVIDITYGAAQRHRRDNAWPRMRPGGRFTTTDEWVIRASETGGRFAQRRV
ncbi:hypothetical protein, partial [Salinisphaera sp.]|uniref:hypothetical protein n=1 Tax=Salinisphaera sp. TaxID=1914330 RepID=UPI0025D368FC